VAFSGAPDDVRNWPRLDRLAPHARAVVDYADHTEIAAPSSHLMNNLGLLLMTKAQYLEAEPLFRSALAIDEARRGRDHSDVVTPLNNLARLLQADNRLSEAEPLFRRALAIDEASYGPKHPNVAISLNNLALLLRDTNRLADAEPLFLRALTIDEV